MTGKVAMHGSLGPNRVSLLKPASITPNSNGKLLLVAFGLVLVAWMVLTFGRERVSQLDVSRWGTDIDVVDSLQIDQYRVQQLVPYARVGVLLDMIALWALFLAGSRGPVGRFGTLVVVIWLTSIVLHGLFWIVAEIFAL